MTFKVFYEVFMILLIITYGIVLLTPPEQNPTLTHFHLMLFDWAVLTLLAADFGWRLWKAEDRKRFLLRNGWELIALIPLDPSFRFVRLLRFLRLVTLVRKSPLIWELLTTPALLRVSGFTVVVILWSSLGIYIMEHGINDHIGSFGDAVWWSLVTTTTVGYGDISPVSLGGRIIAVFLMITGIGMIGTFTASLATHWIQYTRRNNSGVEAEQDIKDQLALWVQSLEKLTDKEYRLMLDTMDLLRRNAVNGAAADALQAADKPADDRAQQPQSGDRAARGGGDPEEQMERRAGTMEEIGEARELEPPDGGDAAATSIASLAKAAKKLVRSSRSRTRK